MFYCLYDCCYFIASMILFESESYFTINSPRHSPLLVILFMTKFDSLGIWYLSRGCALCCEDQSDTIFSQMVRVFIESGNIALYMFSKSGYVI